MSQQQYFMKNIRLTSTLQDIKSIPRRYWTYLLVFFSLVGFGLICFLFSIPSSIDIPRAPKNLVQLNNRSKKELMTPLFAAGGGRGLGNGLFEILSLLGIAKTLNRRPVINVANMDSLRGIVQNIFPIFPELIEQFDLKFRSEDGYTKVKAHSKGTCRFDDPAKFLDNQQDQLYLQGSYFQSFRYFDHIRSDVRKWLIPKQQFFRKADEKLPKKYRDDFILCVHIRRGDFVTDNLHDPSNANFTRFSTELLVRKYQKSIKKNVSVVIIGNDLKWAYSVFKDKAVDVAQNLRDITSIPKKHTLSGYPKNSPIYTVIIKDTPRETDMTFSRKYCDSVLMTAASSTFGWFLGYTSKTGNEVYYRNIYETKDKVAYTMTLEDYFPPEWVMLNTTKNGKIIEA